MTDRPLHLDASCDAVIVGGGPAGLSAALVLGRANKRVLVVDDDRPANAVSQGVGGLLAHDRVMPADLRRSGRRQLEEHPDVAIHDGAVVDIEPTAGGFVVTLTDAAPVRAHAIVLAHGLRYDPPPLPGIEALWGQSVFHCAFCDGWEVRDRPLALHGSGPGAVRLGAPARRLEQRCRAVHGRRAGSRRRGSGSRGRARPDRADRPARRERRPPRTGRVLRRPGRAARGAVRQHAARPAERPRHGARVRVDRGRDDRRRRRRADKRRRRVRRRRYGDRSLAVGRQRDRRRIALSRTPSPSTVCHTLSPGNATCMSYRLELEPAGRASPRCAGGRAWRRSRCRIVVIAPCGRRACAARATTGDKAAASAAGGQAPRAVEGVERRPAARVEAAAGRLPRLHAPRRAHHVDGRRHAGAPRPAPVTAYDANTGEERWTLRPPRADRICGASPAPDPDGLGGLILASDRGCRVAALLDAGTGKLRWRRDLGGRWSHTANDATSTSAAARSRCRCSTRATASWTRARDDP